MRYLLQQSRLQYLIKNRNGYLILASASLTLNILLVLFLFVMVGRERIVVVPPEIQKSFWLTSNKVSPEYLSEMTLYLTSLSFNMTPSSAAMQHEILLRYVDPSYYPNLKSNLLEVEEKIKKEHITMTFFPRNISVDTKLMIGRVMGDLHYMVGDIQMPSKQVTYQYEFSYNNGQLKIKSFPEVKNHG